MFTSAGPLELVQHAVRAHVRDLDGVVPRGRRDQRAVFAELHGGHLTVVNVREILHQLAGLDAPETDKMTSERKKKKESSNVKTNAALTLCAAKCATVLRICDRFCSRH